MSSQGRSKILSCGAAESTTKSGDKLFIVYFMGKLSFNNYIVLNPLSAGLFLKIVSLLSKFIQTSTTK